LEKVRVSSTAIATRTPAGDTAGACSAWLVRDAARRMRLRSYQLPTLASRIMPSRARTENHATLAWPRGRTMRAASNGPIAEPTPPPTWNSDCARPCRPPEANRAMRAASG
jgi:hypothetical protein